MLRDRIQNHVLTKRTLYPHDILVPFSIIACAKEMTGKLTSSHMRVWDIE